MNRITFEEALDHFVNCDYSLQVTAENNLHPEHSSIFFEVYSIKQLCKIYSDYGDLYYDIRIYKS